MGSSEHWGLKLTYVPNRNSGHIWEKNFFVTDKTGNIYVYKWNTKARSRIYCCRGKTICVPFSEYVSLSLVVQHAACPVWLLTYSSLYFTKIKIFGKKLLNRKCTFRFSLQLLYETFLILRTIRRCSIINVHRHSCQVPVILVGF
jgi:hypothetical protein